MTPEAVFLDFDGTLVESLDLKVAAFRTLYAPFGRQIEDKAAAYYRANTGISRFVRIRRCHRDLLGEDIAADELQRLSDRFGRLVEDKVVACDAVPGALAFLDRYRGVLPLFIASATPQAELERIVERRRMAAYFTDIVGSPPDKTAILHDVIATHWFDPAAVVMIGDGRSDFDAAAANGVRFIGRVPRGETGVFPPGTTTVADLRGLEL